MENNDDGKKCCICGLKGGAMIETGRGSQHHLDCCRQAIERWKSGMELDLIVTRHPGLVEYLREIGLATDATQVVAHATPEEVSGKRVCGVLPHNLSCLCESFTEVPLLLPQELRGAELSLEQVRQYAGKPVTYRVRAVEQ